LKTTREKLMNDEENNDPLRWRDQIVENYYKHPASPDNAHLFYLLASELNSEQRELLKSLIEQLVEFTLLDLRQQREIQLLRSEVEQPNPIISPPSWVNLDQPRPSDRPDRISPN
jgi:hypothetical protein